MTDCFRVEFVSNTTLMVYEKDTAFDGRLSFVQPFNPQTGQSWSSEQEALDWWETVKHHYEPPEVMSIDEEESEEQPQEESNG